MKKMKHSILAYLLFLLVGLSPRFSSCQSLAENPDKPNILLFYVDDVTYTAVHALGNNEIITPNLDKMVESGVTFTHAYNMGSWTGAVCIASRAMMNTGRFLWRAEASNYDEMVGRGEIWSQLLKKGGYNTYMAGKWHVQSKALDVEKLFNQLGHVHEGNPGNAYTGHKWDFVNGVKELEKQYGVGSSNGIVPVGYNQIMPFGFNRPLSPADTAWQPWNKQLGGYWEGGKHWSEVLGNDAVAFLNSAKENDDPFFMYLAFNAAHYLRQSPKEYIDMYSLKNISLPESYLPVYPYRSDSIDQYFGQTDLILAPFPRSEYAMKVHRQEYYALITHMDHEIGRILDALEKSGKADNTYIFFTADQGVAVGDHGMMGKQNM
ncbi:MAG: sulfatase-like hydrolase/transferase, partial [Bacteroidales bacterium]|nr:sulfatase-like hydrolase/transferase [Bacteroidales bacterium]